MTENSEAVIFGEYKPKPYAVVPTLRKNTASVPPAVSRGSNEASGYTLDDALDASHSGVCIGLCVLGRSCNTSTRRAGADRTRWGLLKSQDPIFRSTNNCSTRCRPRPRTWCVHCMGRVNRFLLPG